MASASLPAPALGRAAPLKAFDYSRTGVRGLVESSVSSVQELFRHPDPYGSLSLASAARSWGFFHLVNHQHALPNPVPAANYDYPARALAAVRAFNELVDGGACAALRPPRTARAFVSCPLKSGVKRAGSPGTWAWS
ncbi:uncharacterized protein LOC120652061 [Panicum virgatum]|uniref:uncharacterized protein LOC120652061 n=1 Tax=Panicum virgatum TaxID=38727 RepID=UPI0019D656B5|nr:uncharacterized protein LOC120652061 [Panicum virgatum]